jgi:hypothetical protein
MKRPISVSLLGLTFCGMAVVSMAVAPPAMAQAAATCPSTTAKTFELNVIRNFRVYTDPVTHESKVEQVPITAKQTKLFSTGKILKEFNFGDAKRVQIVVAPADLELPMHPAPYRENFLMLSGTVDMAIGDGTHIALGPGDMVTMDDVDSKIGHGGRIGPCGYVDLEIVPK